MPTDALGPSTVTKGRALRNLIDDTSIVSTFISSAKNLTDVVTSGAAPS